MTHNISIAIDGYSACGKSTLAKALAQELGYTYIDTGAMYRAVTLFAMQQKFITADGVAESELVGKLNDITIDFVKDSTSDKQLTRLNGEVVEQQIRSLEIASWVSKVAAIADVRKFLVAQQQTLAKSGGVVMDGRDIGTVVIPNAELKLFMTASPEVRAQRRFLEMQAKGESASLEEILESQAQRDYIDTHRAADPLRQAQDAIVLDNSDLTQRQQLDFVLDLVQRLNA